MSQKLLGMGYAGNFKYNEQKQPDPKLIEMDFMIGFMISGLLALYY